MRLIDPGRFTETHLATALRNALWDLKLPVLEIHLLDSGFGTGAVAIAVVVDEATAADPERRRRVYENASRCVSDNVPLSVQFVVVVCTMQIVRDPGVLERSGNKLTLAQAVAVQHDGAACLVAADTGLVLKWAPVPPPE